MNLFSKKKETAEEFEDYSTLTLPFIDELSGTNNDSVEAEAPATEPLAVKVFEREHKYEAINVYHSTVSPIDALNKKMQQSIAETSSELTPTVPEVCEQSTSNKDEENSHTKKDKQCESSPSESPLIELRTEKPKPSLLKRCMPYIYDDEGIVQIDTKPDYVLESVEDIIKSAEQRAEEKIAKRYKLIDSNGNAVKIEKLETSIKTQAKSEEPSPTKSEKPLQKTAMPTAADVLFDDFSGKRTVVTATQSVTTPYSKLTELQTGIRDIAEDKTLVMPAVGSARLDTMEDIVSHTRPVNIKDAPAIKAQKPVAVTVKNDDNIPDVDDDYRSHDDTKRIGLMLKKARRTAFFKVIFVAFATVISAVFALILPDSVFSALPFLPCLIQFTLLCISAFVNINIFSAFKAIFTKNTAAAAPIALAVSAMLLYIIFGLIFGTYPSDVALLTFIALSAYDFFSYKRASTILNNFRIVASRSEKKAIALIDDQVTASSMARSSIEGEVLAAGVKRTSTLTDFIKFTSCDSAFDGHLGTLTSIFTAVSLLLAVIIGVSHRSFDTALSVIALTLSIFAMPTFSLAEFMPLAELSKKLYKFKAMICSKYSASRIEQCNAVVITSADLFPKGSIELFNMKTLSANNIDNTLTAAASIAEAIKSPLVSVFDSFVDPSEKRPAADTVKYEDNLGISGWVNDEHYFVGNRTLLEAHGIKVPPLEVDRKILHRGYFPVYVAKGQRACALLIVKYRADRKLRSELVRLINAGVTLLIENCDCNITSDMLSDYYAIYPDSIKIMDHKGVHNYKAATNYSEYYSAHAAYIGRSAGFFAIMNGALKLRTVSNIMYAMHIVLSTLVCIIFALSCLDGRLALLPISVCALIELISLTVALITYYIARR